MSTLRIIHPGMLSTVQDLGRPGYSSVGVPTGGAADTLSFRIANRLVGNSDHAAAIEFTLSGATLEFLGPATIAVTGDATSFSAGSRSLPSWRAHALEPCTISIPPLTNGCRVYLAIAGGIEVPVVMGSRSTHLAAALGGLRGTPLASGDELSIGEPVAPPRSLTPDARTRVRSLLSSRTLRVCDGHGEFAADSLTTLWSSPYRVLSQSDRVGIRLSGPALRTSTGGRMPSEGMARGFIQVPENGQPIILGVDHPTTGGYPVIGAVASVDLPILGQLRPHDTVRFEHITPGAARSLYLEWDDFVSNHAFEP